MDLTAKDRDRRQGFIGLASLAAAVPSGLLVWWLRWPPTPALVEIQDAFLNRTSVSFTVALNVGFFALLYAFAWRLAQRWVGVHPAGR
ncbi:MAG: hypothetical protein AAF928_19110 [Myxococcota bacterium]